MTDTVNTLQSTVETPEAIAPSDAPALSETSGGIAISLEAILYIAIIVLSILVRLPDIDLIPLTSSEAHEALAAHRALHPDAPGIAPVSQNPLMFSANLLVMAIGGSENVSARFATLALGVGIVAMPLLFRRWFGPAVALILSGLLALSPALLIASRTMSGAVWSIALALGAVWCIGRFLETRRATFAIAATCLITLLAVAAEPAGLLTLIAVSVGALFATSTAVGREGQEHPFRGAWGEVLRAWPWLRAVPIAALTLIAIGTVFLFYPPALSSIGEALNAGLSGIVTRPEGYPAAYPLLNSLLYEPLFWIFGLAGAYFVLTDDPNRTSRERQFAGRALIGWLVASAALSLLYAGAQPAHTLWLTIPLVGLSAFAIEKALTPVRDPFWHVPPWAAWLHAAAVVAILFIATVNMVYVGWTVLNAAPGVIPELQQAEIMKLVMVLLAAVLMVITFFLIGSIWGARTAWRGLGTGLLIFLGMYTFNLGWGAAVLRADDPREPWYTAPPTRSINLLVETVRKASLRATGVPDAVEIALNIPDDSPLAWALRHYQRAYYVENLAPTINVPVVIGPGTIDQPQLGAEYVGERYATYRTWDSRTLTLIDLFAWLYNRQTRRQPDACVDGTALDIRQLCTEPTPGGYVLVWVRADIYGVESGAGQPER